MLFQVLLAVIAGILTGTFSGLTPGIHINLISLLVLSSSSFLLAYFSVETLAIYIISMAITHTFLDTLPSIYLGAPDEAQALNALPGHKYLMQGLGHYAVILTLIGSFGALLFGLLISPLLLFSVKFLYPWIKPVTAFILILLMIYMIFKSTQWRKNLVVFLLSGTLGLIVLNTSNLKQPLFPLLSGLFGMSVLISSFMETELIMKQSRFNLINIKASDIRKPIIASGLAGFMASFLPGLGASEAAIIATQFFRRISQQSYMILVGGINTASMLLSLITLFAIDKARNGAVVVISELMNIDLRLLILLFAASLVAGSISVILTLRLSKTFSQIIGKIDYQQLILIIIISITLLVIKFSGFIGLLVLITSASLGVFTNLMNIGKHNLMGCLILPVIIYLL